MQLRPSPQLATIFLAAAICPLDGNLLAPDSTTLHRLAAGQEFDCTLVVPSGQAAEITIVEKQAFAGMAEAGAEDGTEIHIDPSKRLRSATRLTLVSGRFEIRITPANHSPLERIFELHTSAFRPAAEPNTYWSGPSNADVL